MAISNHHLHSQFLQTLRCHRIARSRSIGRRGRTARIVAAARKAIEGVSDELNAMAMGNLDLALSRRRVRESFVDIQQNLDHFLFKSAGASRDHQSRSLSIALATVTFGFFDFLTYYAATAAPLFSPPLRDWLNLQFAIGCPGSSLLSPLPRFLFIRCLCCSAPLCYQKKSNPSHYKMEQIFIMIKPDGVHRGLVGEIISRFEKKGFSLKAMKLITVERSFAENHCETSNLTAFLLQI